MADDVVFKLTTVYDGSQIAEGLPSSSAVIESTTADWKASFASASIQMQESNDALIASIKELTTAISTIPKATQRAAEESTVSLSLLEEKFVGAAEAARLSAGGIGNAFGGLSALLGGGIAVGFLANFLNETNKAVLELGHLSEKTGVAIQSLAGLQSITGGLGINFEVVQQGLMRLERAQALAVEGSKQQADSFARVGITVQQIRDSSPEQLFAMISGAIQKSKSASDSTATAFSLLGRGGASLIPIFKEYGNTIDEVMQKEGEQTGVTQQAYQEALLWQKTTSDLSTELRKLGIEAIPVVTEGIKDIIGTAKNADAELLAFVKSVEALAAGVGSGDWATAFIKMSSASDEASQKIQKNNYDTAVSVLGLEQAVKSYAASSGDPVALFASLNQNWDAFAAKIKATNDPFHIQPLLSAMNKGAGTPSGATGETKENEARIEAHKKENDAIIAQDEAMQRHLFEMGQLTQAQELAALEVDEQKKIQLEISTLEQINAAKAKTGGDDGKAEIIKNLGEIQALKTKAQTEEIEGNDKVVDANLRSIADGANRQIEVIRSVAAASVQEEVEQDAKILGIRQQVNDAFVAQNRAASDKGKATYKELEDAVRSLSEAEKKQSVDAIEQIEKQEKSTRGQIDAEYALAKSKTEQQVSAVKSDAGTGDISKLGEQQQLRSIYQTELSDLQAANSKKLAEERDFVQSMQQIVSSGALTGDAQTRATQQADAAQKQLNEDVAKFGTEQASVESKLNSAAASAARLSGSWSQYFKDMQHDTESLSVTLNTTLQKSIDSMISGFSQAFAKAIVEGKNLQQAMEKVAAGILESMISMLTQWLVKWIVTHVEMMIISKIFGDGQTANQKIIQQNVTQAESDAGVAGAAAFAGTLAESGGTDLPGALAAGAAAVAAGQAFVADASAAQGFDVGNNPVKTQLHPREMVLPRDLAGGVRDMVKNNNTNTSNTDKGVHIGKVVSSPTIHGATDPKAVAEEAASHVMTKLRLMGVPV